MTENAVKVMIVGMIDSIKVSAEGLKELQQQINNSVKVQIGNFNGTGNRDTQDDNKKSGNMVKTFINSLKGNEGESDEEKKSNQTKAINKVASFVKSGLSAVTSLSKKSLDIVKQIFNRMKAASPLLEAIDSLFNLAMTLFFMPLGNKLATVLIPAVINLVDDVMKMWDEIGDGGLDEIFNKAMEYGARIFSKFFSNIAETLSNSSNSFLRALGTIANLISKLVNSGIIDSIIKLATFVVSHIPLLIGTIITLMGTIISLQVTAMFTEALSDIGFGVGASIAMGVATSAAVGLGVGLGVNNRLNSSNKENTDMAEGGYVAPRSGGTWKRLAEKGKGEYVVPEDEYRAMKSGTSYTSFGRGTTFKTDSSSGGSLGGTNITNNFYITGYTDSELTEKIQDVVDEQVQLSDIKGGF